jgi:outer membrane lipoprotein-sorting protein
MNELNDRDVDEQLRGALGSPAAADFEAFRRRHADAVAYLNPVVTAKVQRRRKMFMRVISLAVASTIIVAAGTWLLAPREFAFAQTVKTIDRAETMSCTITTYFRYYSEDGKRTWLVKESRWERAFMSPGRFRDTRYDRDGNISSVDIEETNSRTVLHLDMKKKVATLEREPSGQFGTGNLFAGVVQMLKSKPVEFVGQRDLSGTKVNVFHFRKQFMHEGMPPSHENWEIWLDAKSKQLLGYCTSRGNEYFDPATAADRNNPPETKFKKGEIAGSIIADIVLDAQLDPNLFSLTPPDGFTVIEAKPRPMIGEEQFVELLRVTARVNDGIFVDSDRGLSRERQVSISDKRKEDRSQAEQEYGDIVRKHGVDGNIGPMSRFAVDSTEPRSFRYLGKGVKLGAADRIVCFYKLKSTGKYRAVYGDLTVKEVDPKDLPLPVGE